MDRIVSVSKRLQDFSVDDVWHFLQNVQGERECADLTPQQLEKLFDYETGFGNITSRYAYYRQAYCRPLHRAVRAIFSRFAKPRILDICSGTGSQSILFALLGASVVGIDWDPEQLETAIARRAFYERTTARTLDVQFHRVDVEQADFRQFGNFDGAYSHIGVGQVLEADDLLTRVRQCLNPGGLVILKNGNPQCLWGRAVGHKPPDSPRRDYRSACNKLGLRVLSARGTTAVPRALWRLGNVLRAVDLVLRPALALQVHLEYIFQVPQSDLVEHLLPSEGRKVA